MADLKMELEFDKEIDAILRKSRGSGAVAENSAAHVDADAIAAFVENALPDKMRRLYTEHFADCDRCRKLLSNTILMNQTAASMAAVGAAEIVSTAIVETTIPWYKSIFRTPNLAMAMGALVLTFSAVLGYLVLQNRNAEVNISQATEPEMQKGGPYLGIEAPAANTNSAAVANVAPLAANSANASAVAPVEPLTANKPLAGPSAGESRLADGYAAQPEAEKEVATGAAPAAEPAKPAVAAAPPPVDDKTQPDAVARAVRSEEAKDEDAALAKRKATETRRDMPPPAAKAGPTRSAGPVQNQSNQVNQNVFDMAVTRQVGGKTFENRNGAWYDRAYKNQSTTNVRRGTEEYKKLDSGLRSIADNLGGTVILVWKEKAYRIN